MSNFLRQKYKEKSQAWGPVESVQRSLAMNAERIGIDYEDIALAMPMWSPGNQQCFTPKGVGGTNISVNYAKNKLNFSVLKNRIITPVTRNDISNTNTLICKIRSTATLYPHIICDEESNRHAKLWLYTDRYSYAWGGTEWSSASGAITTTPIGVDRFIAHVAEPLKSKSTLWVNNKQFSIAISNTSYTGTQKVVIGIRGDILGYEFAGDMFVLYWFNCALKNPIIGMLSDNPYQLFQRQGDVYFSIPVSAGGTELTATDITTGTTVISASTIGQVHSLTLVNVATGTTVISASTIDQLHTLTPVNVATGTTIIPVSTIGQVHSLTSTDTVSTPILTAPSLVSVNALASDNIMISPVVGSSTIAQIHGLTSTSVNTTPVITTSTISQTHTLTSVNITSVPIITSPVFAGVVALTSISITIGNPVVSTATIGQRHNTMVIGVVTIPVVNSSTIAQTQNLTVANVVATPVVDEPTVRQIHDFTSVSIVSTPVITTSILTEISILTATDISMTPIITASSISQVHILTGQNLAANPPTFLWPFLDYVPVLTRTVGVSLEYRNTIVLAESRNTTVLAENRIVIIAADNRAATV